jgi:hypothetical protein
MITFIAGFFCGAGALMVALHFAGSAKPKADTATVSALGMDLTGKHRPATLAEALQIFRRPNVEA